VFICIKKDKVKIATSSETEVIVLTDKQVEQFLFHLEKGTEGARKKCIIELNKVIRAVILIFFIFFCDYPKAM